MAANLDMTNGRANIAFLGSRNDVWHHMGQEMEPGQDIDAWAVAAGLGWTAYKVPAIANLVGEQFDHLPADSRFRVVQDRAFIVRGDTGAPLGYVSGEDEAEGYQLVQPRDVLDWFERYIAVDGRFQMDVAGSLDGGRRIWATAKFNGDAAVAGEAHLMRVLMTTTFDASGATTNSCTATRAVCQNTINIALADTKAMIRTRHSTKFDAKRVGKELAQLAQGFEQYKAIGDAMATQEFGKAEIADFFKYVLDIPRDAKKEDVSTRKLNQYADIGAAYRRSIDEGAPKETVWAALQAVTRYVDHDRSVRAGNENEALARFNSAQFGSGAAVKGKAMGLLIPLIKDRVLVAA